MVHFLAREREKERERERERKRRPSNGTKLTPAFHAGKDYRALIRAIKQHSRRTLKHLARKICQDTSLCRLSRALTDERVRVLRDAATRERPPKVHRTRSASARASPVHKFIASSLRHLAHRAASLIIRAAASSRRETEGR